MKNKEKILVCDHCGHQVEQLTARSREGWEHYNYCETCKCCVEDETHFITQEEYENFIESI